MLAILLTIATSGGPAEADGAVPAPTGDQIVPPLHAVVIRAFEQPETPYGPGHRGIDLEADPGTLVAAAFDGQVTFAGVVAGNRTLTLDDGGGRLVSYSYLGATFVRTGTSVLAGEAVAATGPGHPGSSVSHLHMSLRLGSDRTYADPLPGLRHYLRAHPVPAVRLMPLGNSGAA